jgi:Fe2+ or Zn2+ uptake regulation protein
MKNIWNETIFLKNNPFHVHLMEDFYYCPHCKVIIKIKTKVDIAIKPPLVDTISFTISNIDSFLFGKCSDCEKLYKINLRKLEISKIIN